MGLWKRRRRFPARAPSRAPSRADDPGSFDRLIRRFFSGLHARLGPRCFVRGAFVAEIDVLDPRVASFLAGLRTHGRPRPFAATHDDFRDPAKLAAHRLCGSRCSVDPGALRADRQREYVFDPPLRGLCAPGDATKGVLLFYEFSVADRRFLYMKLEGHPAMSVAHARAALRRYVLRRPDPLDGRLSRRENSYKDSRARTPEARAAEARRAAEAAAANVAQLWPLAASHARRYDATLRTGMEMYLPPHVVTSLLA